MPTVFTLAAIFFISSSLSIARTSVWQPKMLKNSYSSSPPYPY